MTATERTNWLGARQRGIGGTDIASIAGVGFQTALDVFEEKVAAEPIDRPPSPIMMMGLATEDHNAHLYAERTGATLMRPGLVWSKIEPWQFATFDRIARFDSGDPNEYSECRPVETKYCLYFGDDWGEDGSDQIPDGYIIQATWQIVALRSTGRIVHQADVSALAGTGEHRRYPVRYDERLAVMLLELGRAFWKFVEARTPPLDWVHPLQDEIATHLTKIRPDTTIALAESAQQMADAYAKAKDAEKEAKQLADGIKAALRKELGEYEEGILPDGRRVRQRVTHRKAYQVEATSYVDFRILNPKKEKVHARR